MKKIVGYVFWMLSRVDEPWYSWINSLANRLILWRHPEVMRHFGELNADKTFYVIREFPVNIGLAGWYDRVLGYLMRAEKKGYVPVIDCSEWGDYFNYPSMVTMDEVRKSASVVEAVTHGVVYKRISSKNIALRNQLAARVPMTDAALAFCDEKLKETIGTSGKEIVGVYFRGSDYRKTAEWNAVGHSTVPTYDQFFAKLDRQLSDWGLVEPTIFAVTEEQAILDEFKHRYPSVRFVDKPRFVDFKFGISLPQQTPGSITKRENNLLYLADLHILSRCNYLVGTMNGGIQLALNWNGNRYSGVSIFDFGTNRP